VCACTPGTFCITTGVVVQVHGCKGWKLRNFPLVGPLHRKFTEGSVNVSVAHAHDILPVPDMDPSGHVTSGDVRTHIPLMYLHLNDWKFCRVKSENTTLFMLSLIF
jgi:hypothetical protein